jgi:hypothetical protein
MKMVKSLLLGSAAGLVAIAGAQAADLPVKAKPVQYVKICSLYGAGFYYIPGTDTCIKIGGYMRAEVNFNAGGSFAVPATLNQDNRNAFFQDWRTRAAFSFDVRSQTAYGTLRSYAFFSATDDNSTAPGNSGTPAIANTTGASGYNRLYAPVGFIQFAGFTAGKTLSFFDFDTMPYTNSSQVWGSNQGGNGVQLFAYTAQFGNGFSASIAAENADGHRMGITGASIAPAAAPPTIAVFTAANQQWPDVVANLRIDQAWGSAQIMGALHDVRATDSAAAIAANGPADHPSDKTGYAIGAGAKINLPMIGAGDYIIGQVTYAKGAPDYAGANLSALQTVSDNFPISTIGYGAALDGVVTGPVGGPHGLSLSTSWSFTLGFEHRWSPQWKTSLWGDYGRIKYGSAASLILTPAGAVSGNANWDLWQIGSRTVWTPVANLDLSVEVMYNKLDQNWTGVSAVPATAGATFRDQDWWSGMFRVQRNFWP